MVLPRRLTAARPLAVTIGEAISVLVADQNLASNYAAENDNKALAIEPESGRLFRSGGVPTAEVAERTALEGCQISYALPCVLVASNDQFALPIRSAPSGAICRACAMRGPINPTRSR